jgi:hypothetical protein
MKMYSVCDPEFVSYGKVLNGYDASEVIGAMNAIPLPENDVAYEPSILALETCDISTTLQNNAYGGMPVQLGLCWGRNTKLNCLEYCLCQSVPGSRRRAGGGIRHNPSLRSMPFR